MVAVPANASIHDDFIAVRTVLVAGGKAGRQGFLACYRSVDGKKMLHGTDQGFAVAAAQVAAQLVR